VVTNEARGAEFQPGQAPLPVKDIGRLLVRCADRPGLVAAVTGFLAEAGANIISLDQHSTQQTGGIFMQRTIFHLPGLTAARDDLEREFVARVAEPFGIDFRLTEAAKPKRVALMASNEDHCLLDLLWRNSRGELGGFNRSMQHRVVEASVVVPQRLRPGSSSRGPCVVCC